MTNERLRQLWGTAVDTCHLRVPDANDTPYVDKRSPEQKLAALAAQRTRRLRELELKPFDNGDDHKEILRMFSNLQR